MQEPPTAYERCAHIKDDGERCRAYAVKGTGYYFFHNPTPEGRLRAFRARGIGGQNSGRMARAMRHLPANMREVFDKLSSALDGVLCGELEPNRASAAASLARAMVSVLDAAEVLDRVAALEALLGGNGYASGRYQ